MEVIEYVVKEKYSACLIVILDAMNKFLYGAD